MAGSDCADFRGAPAGCQEDFWVLVVDKGWVIDRLLSMEAMLAMRDIAETSAPYLEVGMKGARETAIPERIYM